MTVQILWQTIGLVKDGDYKFSWSLIRDEGLFLHERIRQFTLWELNWSYGERKLEKAQLSLWMNHRANKRTQKSQFHGNFPFNSLKHFWCFTECGTGAKFRWIFPSSIFMRVTGFRTFVDDSREERIMALFTGSLFNINRKTIIWRFVFSCLLCLINRSLTCFNSWRTCSSTPSFKKLSRTFLITSSITPLYILGC